MQTHAAKRIEIIIEAPMQRRLEDTLQRAGATGYSVLPVMGGFGTSGEWSREGQVGRAGGLVAVVCIVRPALKEAVLEAIFAVLERHIGVVSVSDCEVLRPGRF